jgi:hypothetical protein
MGGTRLHDARHIIARLHNGNVRITWSPRPVPSGIGPLRRRTDERVVSMPIGTLNYREIALERGIIFSSVKLSISRSKGYSFHRRQAA